MPSLDVRGRRQPFEILLCAASVLSAVSYFAGVAPPAGSLASSLPGWALSAWYLQLLPGGIIGLVSAAWSRRHLARALRMSLVAMALLSSALTTYAVAAFAVNGTAAVGGGLLIAAWAGACVWRGWHVYRDLRTVKQLQILSVGELTSKSQEPP